MAYFRSPKTQQERAASGENHDLIRSKRNASALPDTWSDIPKARRSRDKGSKRKNIRRNRVSNALDCEV